MKVSAGLPVTSVGLAPRRHVLANGLTILAKESKVTPAVTLHASVKAGTIFDPAAAGGLAHFVSRTIDRGTPKRSADDIAEALDIRGVSLNVSVNRHAISLVCTCLVEDFSMVLALLADIVVSPSFPETEVETRRGEIITLIRQDEDSPSSVAPEKLMALLYGAEHPYGRPPRGTIESVQRIGRADLQRFHATRFLPRFLSLVVVGDVEPEQAIDTVAAAFGAWGSDAKVEGNESPPQLTRPAPAPGRRIHVVPMMNKAQVDIAYGFTSITRDDPAYHAHALMNNILGQYAIGGRLGDSIRERQGMAYYVFSALDANVIPGPLMIRAGVNPSHVERTLESIDEELSKFVADGPTDTELTESTQYLIGSMPRTLETNAGIAGYLQTIEFFALGLDYDVRVPGLLRAVTREQVHDAARRTLDTAKAAVVIAGPYDGSPR
jgi:zinc protease